jgi:membrane protease YdiL (CAAX protease family)
MTDIVLYFVLACGITWGLDYTNAAAWAAHATAPSYAMNLVGFGAFGPAIAAFIVAKWRGQLRSVFGHWRTNPWWIVIALFTPMLILHLPATLIDVALGGHPEHWFYPPKKPEMIAALFVFSFGEEFGWRGLAYPRLADRVGPVVSCLIVGVVWGLWHFGMMFTPEQGAPDASTVLLYVFDLTLHSFVVAWLFERSGRSIAVAIAIHAGGHLDNTFHATNEELRLKVLRYVVLAIAAAFAARSLRKMAAQRQRG